MNTIIVCAGLLLIGLALQLSRAFLFAEHKSPVRESSMGEALRLLALLTQAGSILLLLTVAMGPFALIAAVIMLFALAEAAWRHVIQERRTLAWLFAAATYQSIPLSEALTAFYSSDDVRGATKGRRLISLLSLGMPLHLALQGASIRLSPGLRLATAQGVALGALPERISKAIADEEGMEEDLLRLNQKIGYTATVFFSLSFILFIATGLMIFVAPTLEKMMSEFDVAMPAPALLSLRISRDAIGSPIASILLIGVLAITPVIALLVALHQFGIPLWDYPLINRCFSAFDRARLYRALAISFRRSESLLPALDQLGIFFPRGYMREKIRRARNRFVHGEPWLSAFSNERLISTQDRQLFESAVKYGNIAWALEEVATIRVQRLIQRLDSLVTLFNTLLILFTGSLALLYGSMVYLTVAELILDLK